MKNWEVSLYDKFFNYLCLFTHVKKVYARIEKKLYKKNGFTT